MSAEWEMPPPPPPTPPVEQKCAKRASAIQLLLTLVDQEEIKYLMDAVDGIREVMENGS